MLIFLAGVHGVGKGYLGKPVAESIGIIHETASSLIRQERGITTWNAGKQVSDIDANQAALVAAVLRIRNSGNNILLDGHFVLRDSEGLIERLPESIFQSLQTNAIVLLEGNAEEIASRLSRRDGHIHDVVAIETLARAELEHAIQVANKLKIPLIRLNHPSNVELAQVVRNLIENVPPNSS